jgi:preprotein translocase SecF subunit
MDLIKKTKIDFVSARATFFRVSIIATIVGLVLVAVLGIDYGIDFEGGTEVAVRFNKTSVTTEQIRGALGSTVGSAEIKSFGNPGEYLIRVKNSGDGSEISEKIMSTLRSSFRSETIILLQSQKIDAKISSELLTQSLLALVVATALMLLYIAFRFEFVYGLGSVVALLHDVLIAFVVSVLFNKTGLLNLETNINSIAAYLTILGYSINDKVVVFDRLRENRELHKSMSLSQLINLSLNETLSRTLITGISVLVALLVLVFFGGEALEGFAFTMFIGIVVGTYSSIYIAASFVLWYTDRVKHKKIGSVSPASTKA